MGADEIYRCLVENQDFVVYQIDAEGIIIYVSPSIEKFSGYKIEEFMGQPFARFIHPEDLHEVMVRFQDAASGTSGFSEFRALHKNGSVLWVHASSRPPQEPPPAGVIGIMTDITERRRAEEALREASELNRQIIVSANEGIVVLDRNFRYITWNPYLEKILGLAASDVLGKIPWEVFPVLEEQGVKELIDRALQGESTVAPDIKMMLPGRAEMRWFDQTHGPLRDGLGNIIGVIVTIRDVTGRHESEQALRESEDRYRDLAENSQDLLCMHDLQGRLLWINPAPARVLGY